MKIYIYKINNESLELQFSYCKILTIAQVKSEKNVYENSLKYLLRENF